MLRHLAPHLATALALAVLAGIGYGTGVIGVPGFYACMLAGAVTVAIGGVRWEQRDQSHPRHRRSPARRAEPAPPARHL